MEVSPGSEARVRPRAAGSAVPLTAWQRILWNRHSQGRILSTLRQCEASLRIRGQLDEELLRRTLEMVVNRHESLRTRIALADGTPMQEVAAESDHLLEVIDLGGGSANEVWERTEQFSKRFLEERINWSLNSPFSTKLLKLSELDHVLLVGIDHMVTDGTSSSIVRQEIASLYQKGERGLSQALPAPPLQFADYALWQQTTLEAWRSKHEHYWRERLSRVPHVDLPFYSSPVERGAGKWTTTEYALGVELSAKLRLIACRERTLFPLTLLSIVAAVLSRWCDQPKWVVDFVFHGRQARPELANMVGYLSTVLPLHFEVAKDESLLDLLKRVHIEYQSALEHHDYGRLPDCMQALSAPMYFNWGDTPRTRATVSPTSTSAGRVELAPFPLHRSHGELPEPWPKVGFLIYPEDEGTAAGIVVGFIHSQNLIPGTTERLGLSLRLFAEKFAANPLVMQRELHLAS